MEVTAVFNRLLKQMKEMELPSYYIVPAMAYLQTEANYLKFEAWLNSGAEVTEDEWFGVCEDIVLGKRTRLTYPPPFKTHLPDDVFTRENLEFLFGSYYIEG